MDKANSVVKFWLDAGPEAWFSQNDAFDRSLHTNFGTLHQQAAPGELDDWQETATGSLALILILDQFSRNMFRNDAKSFAQDAAALQLAKSGLDRGFDLQVDPSLQQFFFMPLMHSEAIEDQQRCVRLFYAASMPDNLPHAITHRDIIARFGRFPHRNKVLGRPSSTAEQKFLDDGGFSG